VGAGNVVGAVFASTEGGRPCVKSVAVMEYAITGKKGDIALSVEAMAFVLMENVRIAAKFVYVSNILSLTPCRDLNIPPIALDQIK
jgi:hypothetical protein